MLICYRSNFCVWNIACILFWVIHLDFGELKVYVIFFENLDWKVRLGDMMYGIEAIDVMDQKFALVGP